MKVLRKQQRLLFTLVILALLSFGSVQQSSANVTLVFFDATSDDGTIVLEWETGTEIDTVGFVIERRSPENGTPTLIDELDSAGDQLTGSNYSSVDESVVNGTAYWYDLYEITASNAKVLLDTTSLVAGQLVQATTPSVTAGTTTVTSTTPTGTIQTPGTTASPTTRAAGGITPSPTQNSSYPGPVVTTAPTSSSLNPGLQLSPTAPLLGSPSATAEIMMAFDLPVDPLSATATLAPLPTIQLIFPTPLAQAGRDPIESAAIVYDAEGELVPAGENNAQPPASRIFLIVLVLLLWVGLGAWFVYLFRHTG